MQIKRLKSKSPSPQRVGKGNKNVTSLFFSAVLVAGLGAGGKSCASALAKATARG
jgi:hypothetical protein